MKYQLACLLGLVLALPAATAQSAEQKIAGDVVNVQGTRAEVRAADGKTFELRIPDDVRISGRLPADLSKLTEGEFVGTTAAPRSDGTLVASEVHIFAESMRGRGEGHRPMEGPAGNTMTNATISRVGAGARSGETGATVEHVASAQGGRSLTLTYKGGEKTVFVPDNIPIVKYEAADRSQLVPGAHVVVYASTQPDGMLSATRIGIGLNGFVPPL